MSVMIPTALKYVFTSLTSVQNEPVILSTLNTKASGMTVLPNWKNVL